MKAITLTQPWSQLVALSAKRWETRDWRTDYRGPLAIHSAKAFPAWARDLCHEHHFAQALIRAGITDPDQLPLGMVVATCQIVACRPTVEVLEDSRLRLSPRQRAFGNWAPGRYAWQLEDIAAVSPPVPTRGSLGLWDLDAEALGIRPLVTGRLF